MSKFKRLVKILRNFKKVIIAYSGGVDSTFLLKVASDTLKENVIAVTAKSPTYTKEELDFAQKFTRKNKIRHVIISTDELKDTRFSDNSARRCYYCKTELFTKLKKIAGKENIDYVIDASNYDDQKDYRPGSIAAKELSIRSPLKEAKFTKRDIRMFSKKMGLETWDASTQACLASRFPYGKRITRGALKKVERAERVLRHAGFKQLRVRHYNGLCRIEVPQKDLLRLMSLRTMIVRRFKHLGYNYVTIDLEGYRSGSLNEVLKKTPRSRAGNVRYHRRKPVERW